ncbi:MAG TPA: ATP-dependent helicase [Opitutaceae bacterium]
MPDFQPTEEQLAITAAARESSDNLIISALAGAAKTSTLVLIAQELSKTLILCLAFNRKIAEEMKERLPGNCEAKTLNSLGNGILRDMIGRWPKVDSRKVSTLIYEAVSSMEQGEEKKIAFGKLSEYGRGLSLAKANGYLPNGFTRPGLPAPKPLCGDEEFEDFFEEELEPWEISFLRAVYTESLNMAFAGDIDYDDQLLLPTLFAAPFPRPALTLIDEAQDLSPLNHAMLKKLVGTRRLIAVGDECQAIYGFRGADSKSMRRLEEEFSMKKLILSVSFRCPIAVVEHARWRAPHMKYPEWAKQGSVSEWHDWTIDEIPVDAAIVCRNNAPLFSLAMRMLKSGRYAQIVGTELTKNLLKTMKKLGPATMPRDAVLSKLDQDLAAKLEKSKDPGPLRDRYECMKVFAREGTTLGEAMAFAEHIFNAQSPTLLMTIHKSKGLEFNDVFILERELIKKEGQDRNLRYVAQTRAKETLVYIDFEGMAENVN